MENTKPRRVRIGRILILTLALLGAAGAGYIYLDSVHTASANGSDSATSDAAADDSAATDSDAQPADTTSDAKEEGEKEKAIPVSVASIQRGAISSYIMATSNLVAEDEVTVLAEAEGQLSDLLVEEGDEVAEGQVLARLAQDDEQIAYDKAMVRAQNAQLKFDRSSRLGSEGLISEEELAQTTMDHRVAQQELAEAAWKVEQTRVLAPFAGRVTTRHITVGQHIRPGDALFVVTDFEPLIARIYLPERDVQGLEPGREVRISLQADAGIVFRGRIRQISPVVDQATGTVKVTIEAIHPPSAVRPGGFVDIAIVRETRSDVVLLPRDAIIRELQRAHVFVVEGDKAQKRDVTLGMEEGDQIEVTGGLTSGEQVVVAGQGGLKNGAVVKLIDDPTKLAKGSNGIDSDRG